MTANFLWKLHLIYRIENICFANWQHYDLRKPSPIFLFLSYLDPTGPWNGMKFLYSADVLLLWNHNFFWHCFFFIPSAAIFFISNPYFLLGSHFGFFLNGKKKDTVHKEPFTYCLCINIEDRLVDRSGVTTSQAWSFVHQCKNKCKRIFQSWNFINTGINLYSHREILSLFLPQEYKYKSRRICLQNLPIINMPNTIVFALEAGEVGHNQPGSEEEAARQERAATAEAARRKKACRETC
jgi:hypothetical protein